MKWHISNIKSNALAVQLFWEHKDGMRLKLLEPIVYYRRGECTDNELLDDIVEPKHGLDKSSHRKEIIVPKGYTTDGASIPKIFWWLLSPFEDYFKCCVLHDYLCDLFHLNLIERKTCDSIFKEALEETHIKKSTRWALYFFVRSYTLVRYNPICNALFGKGEVEWYNKEFFANKHHLANLYAVLDGDDGTGDNHE